MKNNTVKKDLGWVKPKVANSPETIKGAKIAWQFIKGSKNRGVFALDNFKKGEVIEISPVITVSKKDVKENGQAPDGYLLQWDADIKGEEYCMPMGYVMMYNHSSKPNILIDSDQENYTMTVSALRDIKAGEELAWNYSCELWFDEA